MIATLTAAIGRLTAAPRATEGKSLGALVAFDPLGRAGLATRDYASFAREGMLRNPIVYRAVRMIAEAAASVPLLVYAGDDELPDHALQTLVERPNGEQSRADFLEAWCGHLLVAGHVHAKVLAVGEELRELHLLRPDRVQPVIGADGWTAGYDYRSGDRITRLTGEAVPGVRRVTQMRLFHPLDDHRGLATLEPAAAAIELHNAASRWNKALLDNSARPSGALVYSGGTNLTAEQFERLKSELEGNFQGARNVGRPLLLEGGLDWKAMSLTPRDMDFIEAKHVAAREIALAIGVPPMLLGIPGDNTYANYKEANRTFWRQTVLPLVSRTAAHLSDWLSPAWPGAVRLVPDLDAVEALSPDREALWARLEAATFLTVNEKRAALGYPPLPDGDAI